MKKRSLGIILLILSIIATAYLLFFKDNIKNYDSLILSNKEYEAIKQGKTKANIYDEISFNDYPLLFDKKNNCLYYSLIQTNKYSYTPVVKWRNKNIKIAFKNEKITDNLIHFAKNIKVLMYNDNSYSEYDLVCTSLPLINIEVEDEIIKDHYVPMKISVFDNSEHCTRRLIQSDGHIRIKGHTTTTYPKKNFRLELTQESIGGNTRDNDVALLGLRADDDFVLNAGYNDQEKIRNTFSSRLWYESSAGDNVIGVKNGMYYKYAEMFINNEYWGLYALGYPIDEKTLGIDKQSSKTELEENLYQKDEWSSETKAHLYGTSPLPKYDLKTNKESPANAWRFLRKYYRTLFNTNNPQDIYDMIDINNSIDMYLFCSLMIGVDTASDYEIKNMFFSSKQYEDRLIMLYTPWDMDISWGNYWDASAKNYTIPYFYGSDADKNPMLLNPVQYLLEMKDPNIKKLVKERYEYLRNNGWSKEKVSEILDEYEKDIYYSGAYARDRLRWPDGWYMPDNTHELKTFKEFVLNRLDYFDGFVEKILSRY